MHVYVTPEDARFYHSFTWMIYVVRLHKRTASQIAKNYFSCAASSAMAGEHVLTEVTGSQTVASAVSRWLGMPWYSNDELMSQMVRPYCFKGGSHCESPVSSLK